MEQKLSNQGQVMKYVKYTVAMTVTAFALSASLVACGKKSGDSNTLNVGSLSSDGSSVSSNTSISGYPMSMTVQGITPSNNGYINNQQQCGYNNYGQYVCGYINGYGGSAYSAVVFSLTINGQSQQLQTSLSYLGSSSYSSRSQTTVGGFQVLYQAACYNSDCSEFLLEIDIGTGYLYRQIAIRKSMSQNKIIKLGEWENSPYNLRSLSTIMGEI